MNISFIEKKIFFILNKYLNIKFLIDFNKYY